MFIVDVATKLDSLIKNQLKEDHLKRRAKEENKRKSSHLENIWYVLLKFLYYKVVKWKSYSIHPQKLLIFK